MIATQPQQRHVPIPSRGLRLAAGRIVEPDVRDGRTQQSVDSTCQAASR